MITPFTLAIPQADLDDLKARLARVRWANELSGVGTDYGVPLSPIKRLVKYWQEGYDWRIWEAKLNAYPQFTTTIDGQNIYFLHIRSREEGALPLLLTHGWPSSVVDYLDLIGPLTDPRSHGGEAAQAFHLVIPSLPGFGFSGPTHAVGWDRYRVARAWAELMHRLGYERYGLHGNDWGSIVSPEVGRCDPEHVVGVHVTQIFSEASGDPAEMEALSEEEKQQWQAIQWWEKNKGVYNLAQSTVPQTLAHALADSPVGQLAWNYQIYGDDESDDYILTNVMIYWLTNTAASSARFYYENAHAKHVPTEPTTIPLGLSKFANDYPAIRPFAERDHKNIVFWRIYDRGNHFATQTAPNLLINDIRAFFAQVRQG
ncbi:epoxide hydrolase [Ktedonosporobacter rubrisoli]|uniref:Epoxide hydrolase n=1 Tax=Ktedonosporobacter rubrisoli TaxID=2509675 RepID=A0A4P6JLR3_KTERU|nr:epoxide hydrolase family protein [Ktedonosporobacter rubrisoli]QBD75932.1 epoxide hydrolase [Ktedonosporobacter rubrisoli]